jgi:hypothetical protein
MKGKSIPTYDRNKELCMQIQVNKADTRSLMEARAAQKMYRLLV